MTSIVPGANRALDDQRDRALAQASLETFRAELQRDFGVDVSATIEHGSPARKIIAFTQERGFDLVVMGTHGRTGFQHLLMGSVAEAVVRLSLCPVLTVHLPFTESPAPAGV